MAENHLIFLHGALGCSQHWERFLPHFKNTFEIHNLDFPGHGNNTEVLDNYTMETLTAFVEKYIHRNNIPAFSVIGYSMGGYVGLNLLLKQLPGYLSLITIATKLEWNKSTAESECEKLTLENLTPIMGKLKNEHISEAASLIEISKEIIQSIGIKPLNKTQFTGNKIPVTMLRGSKDRMVTAEEVRDFTENNSSMHFEIQENQPHNLEKMEAEIISGACLRLLGNC